MKNKFVQYISVLVLIFLFNINGVYAGSYDIASIQYANTGGYMLINFDDDLDNSKKKRKGSLIGTDMMSNGFKASAVSTPFSNENVSVNFSGTTFSALKGIGVQADDDTPGGPMIGEDEDAPIGDISFAFILMLTVFYSLFVYRRYLK